MSARHPPRASVIINPRSGVHGGSNAAAERAALAGAVLAARDVEADIRLTERPGHASELARTAVEHGARLVVAWGGDGTINEVACALAFGPAALGIVPSGSGNGLARALGVPSQPEAALRRALDRAERQIDVGELGGRLFANVAGIGLDARVAARFALGGRRRGLLPYVVYTAAELLRSRGTDYEIEIEGERHEQRALVVALANSREYGNGAIIAPRAEVDDGALDLVVISPMPMTRMLAALPRLFRGTADASRWVSSRLVRHLRISADSPILFHVDGEPVVGATCLEARVHPGALRIRA